MKKKLLSLLLLAALLLSLTPFGALAEGPTEDDAKTQYRPQDLWQSTPYHEAGKRP